MTLAAQMRRLGKHSAVYGLGGIVSRVIAVFLLIVASLFSALFFVYRDRGQSTRALKALALRVGLSVGLFAFLMLGYYFGWFRERL